jgi:hypothetical protein
MAPPFRLIGCYFLRGYASGLLNALSHNEELERKVGTQDEAMASIIAAIRKLTTPPAKKQSAIGFTSKQEELEKRSTKERSAVSREKKR